MPRSAANKLAMRHQCDGVDPQERRLLWLLS
jgi:hypothetical protein